MASHVFPAIRAMPSSNLCLASTPSSSQLKNSLSTGSLCPLVGGSDSSEFAGLRRRPASLSPSFNSTHKAKRDVVTMVIPFTRGSPREQPPPDLASYLFKHRILYLGMPLYPSVTELMIAEFFFLQEDDDKKPIYFYINSTGSSKSGKQLGYEAEAFVIYDIMRFITAPIFTLCVGVAWGEASMLLAAGAKGNRAALPSSTIMMKQPMFRFQGRATSLENRRRGNRYLKDMMVELYSELTGKRAEDIEEDIKTPKYFTPSEAVEYGLIDKILNTEKARGVAGVMSKVKTLDE